MTNRRRFLYGMGAMAGTGALAALGACATPGDRRQGHVVVVGGGFAGATLARHLRLWSSGAVAVTLVERNPTFLSCPLSNRVIGGQIALGALTLDYQRLYRAWGIGIRFDDVAGIDTDRRRIILAGGDALAYDRLALAPGIDFLPSEIPGLAGQELTFPHAWKAGPQTALLRDQIADLPDGGVVALHIPRAPYRCPPGPYERACLIADFLKRHKSRAKLLVLDANPEIQSKRDFFQHHFATLYGGVMEYRPNSELRQVDAASRTLHLDFDNVQADVANVIPPHRAGRVVDLIGAPLINKRWVEVDWPSLAVRGFEHIHCLGDAVFPAPGMPKSAHLANQQGKLLAATLLQALGDPKVLPTRVLVNTCYSFVDARRAGHIATVYRFDEGRRTFLPVPGAGGISAIASEEEGRLATAWAHNIWTDTLG
ncbi:MAG: FCSD flavin-binding domain-containing protein [Zoogloeaceae bacterium]|nr:FCSD flavin-binding domain-containing protein [Zoogloeaceae bacterium]